jgi:hypothetical protein
MLEDFICNHTSITELSVTYKLSSYSVNFFIQQYFGKPDQPYIVEINLNLPKREPIPIKLRDLHKEYLSACEKVELLREAIDRFENNL